MSCYFLSLSFTNAWKCKYSPSQCLLGGQTLPSMPADAGPSDAAGKRRRDQDFSTWLTGSFAIENSGKKDEDADDDDDGDLDASGSAARRLGKKGRPMSQAALAKADREKARRERLND
jgi:hypothetical protein